MPFEWKRKQFILLVVTLCAALLGASRRQLELMLPPDTLSRDSSATATKAISRQRAKIIPITPETPLFVLSLPNSGSIALYRYFKCAGFEPGIQLGRYFTNQRSDRPTRVLMEIGRCMNSNMKHEQQQQSPLYGCSQNSEDNTPFSVWLDMGVSRFNRCFYPGLAPGVLEALYQNYINATILQVTRDPEEWYQTLSYDIREKWDEMCNENHPGVSFPGNYSSQETWIQFYRDYVDHIRDFAGKHPSMNYIEVKLESMDDTAKVLQQKLGFDQECWVESHDPPRITMQQQQLQQEQQQLHDQQKQTSSVSSIPRPADITYPLLLVSMSKSGTTTTHDYFQCGMGGGASIHQWTKNYTTKDLTAIGKCMEFNIQNNLPLVHDCGYYRVWTDIQYVAPNKCFFPQFLQNGGLQAFYKAYPYGTIMNTVRNATAWIISANRWNRIQERWARGAECYGFPPPKSTQDTWIEFYNHQNDKVRQFARDHPSLTYVEVALEPSETASILEDIFGFPEYCWGHSNINKPKS